MSDLEAACWNIMDVVFGPGSKNKIPSPGMIGMGEERIVVYVRGPKKKYHLPLLETYATFPVEYIFDIGEIKPL